MKASTIVKIGIGLSATCAALLSADNARLSKKAKGLEAELEAVKAEANLAKTTVTSSAADYYIHSLADTNSAPASASRSTDDLYDDLELRGAQLTERIIALGERKMAEAEAKQARREQRLAEKEARKVAKAEAKAAKKAAKANG